MFHVNLEKLLSWLDRGGRGHRDTPRNEQLRRLLDANLWRPPPDEKISRKSA